MSNVNACTPFPHVYTKTVEVPYRTYPANTCSYPYRLNSSFFGVPFLVLLNTENIVPTEILTSIFEDPSKGSVANKYSPVLFNGIISSFSSLAIAAT